MTIRITDRWSLDCLSVEVTNNVLQGILSGQRNKVFGDERNLENLKNFLGTSNISNIYALSEKLIRAGSVYFLVVKNNENYHCKDNELSIDVMDMLSLNFLIRYIHASCCSIVCGGKYGTQVEAPDDMIEVLRSLNVSELNHFSMTFFSKWRVIVKIDMFRVNSFINEVSRSKKFDQIKNEMILNGAPVKLIQLLFPEEQLKYFRERRRILNYIKKRGRPRIGSEIEYVKFCDYWEKINVDGVSLLTCFIHAHEKFGLNYEVLFGFYSRYEENRLCCDTYIKIRHAEIFYKN